MCLFIFIIPADFIFPNLVVIETTLGTPNWPKNIFCFNNNIMNDNSKQDHPSKNKFACTLFAELRGRDTRAPTTNLQIVLNTQKNPFLIQAAEKKNLPNFPTQKNLAIENFKPQKDPSIIPVTWNPEYPPEEEI